MRIAGLQPEQRLVIGTFFDAESHEEFVAFIGMYEPYPHVLCPRTDFDLAAARGLETARSEVSAPPGLYRHFKGRTYKAFGEFVHTRTGEIYVPYVGLYQMSAMLVRPRANFLEAVDRPDYAYRGPRFAFIRPC